LAQAVLTVLGVMLLSFILFNLIAGDVSARFVNPKLGPKARDAWLEKHHLNLPSVYNPDSHGQFWKKEFWDTQFYWHMRNCVTFQSTSFSTDQRLQDIVAEKARYSLSLTVPAMILGWACALIISSLVAYYRGTWIDRMGVFLSVLGMCVPYLAYMILGQWVMFHVYPPAAWGLRYSANIYVPVGIAVIAGIGGSVRFYRTILLDEINRDYVRTARAKGVSLPNILFKHVLRNCMLPILTQLILAIPYLIMGALLLEQFFGIPGLGDLMLASISDRDVPIVTSLTFLTAVIDVLALLLTDVLYAVFDPRIRLR
jgi:peptide/nickel transport system permease protein